MCARFKIRLNKALLELYHHAGLIPQDAAPQEIDVYPTQYAPVFTAEDEEPQLFRFGLIPSWAPDPKIGMKMFNARSETITEKPSFRHAFKSRRCLVPAKSFTEWKDADGHKQQMDIALINSEEFFFAGIWENWADKESGEIISSFAIITTDPNETIQPIHNRMPVILPMEKKAAWLDNATPQPELLSLLRPYAAEETTVSEAEKTVTKKAKPGNYNLFGGE